MEFSVFAASIQMDAELKIVLSILHRRDDLIKKI
jgi:hypothetical protein